MKKDSLNCYDLIKKIEEIRNLSIDNQTEINAIYSYLPKNDARITAFSKFINVLNSLHFSFTFIERHLTHSLWWNRNISTLLSIEDKRLYVKEFENFTKVGFVSVQFSSIESSLRLFLRAIDPHACKNSTAAFDSIYKCLLCKLNTKPTDGAELLDLFREVRNTIHNNGVYFNNNGNSKNLTWEGKTFEFNHGTRVSFVTWDFLILISESLRLLLMEILKDIYIKGIDVIVDPFAIDHTP